MDVSVLSRSRRNLIVGVCMLANLCDGYDIMAAALTGSAIAREWALAPAALGLVFSASLAGVMAGSLFISPLGDLIGRRKVALACLAVMGLSMIASGLARDPTQLMAFRLITGLGIGGLLSTLNTLVAEIAEPSRRSLTMSIFSIGYPLGSTIGGLLAIALVGGPGWRYVFLLGGTFTLVVLALAVATLPESARLGRGPARIPFRSLFARGHLAGTAMLCAAFFFNMICFFFVLSWTPRLVEALGLSARTGVAATVVLNAGSLVGGLIYGFFADRLGLRRIGVAYFLAFAILTAIFGLLGPWPPLLLAGALGLGVAMAGTMTCLYVLAPLIFPADVRNSGTGLAIGIGRLGGTLGPMLAGAGLQAGIGRAGLYLIFAIAPLAGAFLVARIAPEPAAILA